NPTAAIIACVLALLLFIVNVTVFVSHNLDWLEEANVSFSTALGAIDPFFFTKLDNRSRCFYAVGNQPFTGHTICNIPPVSTSCPSPRFCYPTPSPSSERKAFEKRQSTCIENPDYKPCITP